MAPPTPATAQTGYLKVPKFIPHAPLVWVQLCKAQFEVLQITDEQQKYNRILSSLSPEVIVAQVGDLIVTPFAAGHLEQLFDTIVEAFSASAIKRLRDVLDNEEQGDRKPSVFYKSMRTKVKDLNVSDDVFYDRWISRLDPQIQTTIAAAKPIAGMTIDQILQIADNVYDHLSSTRSSTSTVSAIGQRQQHHSRGRSFSRNRSTNMSSSCFRDLEDVPASRLLPKRGKNVAPATDGVHSRPADMHSPHLYNKTSIAHPLQKLLTIEIVTRAGISVTN
ncbi:hypothetical protein TYRP_005897 [Tyrophagus putrescentiae]|nr:hypothetical protein TYRP_005897 [Tyrophagus putrescentiae]